MVYVGGRVWLLPLTSLGKDNKISEGIFIWVLSSNNYYRFKQFEFWHPLYWLKFRRLWFPYCAYWCMTIQPIAIQCSSQHYKLCCHWLNYLPKDKNFIMLFCTERPEGNQMVSTLILKGKKTYFKGGSKILKHQNSNCFNLDDV